MPGYREIDNHVLSTDADYNFAENSPGFRAVVQATAQLEMLSGRSLDVGCGVGLFLNYLAGPNFDEWRKLISEHFEIVKAISITNEQILYLTTSIRMNTATVNTATV